MEIPVSYTAIISGLCGSLLFFAGVWWLLARDSWLGTLVLAGGAAFVSYLWGHVLVGRGPGLILSSAGLSVRRGLGDIAYLPWSEATTVELKSAMAQLLVIGMRNPESFMADVRGYRGWVMRRNHRKFGTPFTIAIVLLKWNHILLLQTVATYRCRYGTA